MPRTDGQQFLWLGDDVQVLGQFDLQADGAVTMIEVLDKALDIMFRQADATYDSFALADRTS